MKKLRIAALVMALVMLCAALPALAAQEMTLRTTASVNLRRGPGTGYSKVVAVSKGRAYDYTGVSSYDSRGVVWHKVEYGRSYAWVSSRYSDIKIDGATLDDDKFVRTTANVNLRTGPGTGYRKVTSVSKGTKLFYIGQGKDSSGRVWYRVATGSGILWLTSQYSYTDTKAPDYDGSGDGYVLTTASVNLRKGPGLGYGRITALKKGVKLDYKGDTDTDSRGVKWYKVEYKGKTAWISDKYSDLYK